MDTTTPNDIENGMKPRPSGGTSRQDNGVDHQPRSPALDAERLRQHQEILRGKASNSAVSGGPPGDPPNTDLWENVKRWLARQSTTVLVLSPILWGFEAGLATVHASIWSSTLDIPALSTIDIPFLGQLMDGWGTFSWVSLLAGICTTGSPVIVATILFKSRALDDWRNLIQDRNMAFFFALCSVVWLILAALEFQVFKSNLMTIGQTPTSTCALTGIGCASKTLSQTEISLISGALMVMNGAIGVATGYLLSKIK
ncbi:MAG: hypothetical protein AAFQ66_08740 [Pseudomonadota bacterium]